MAGEQRNLAHASKRDSYAMKTISLLGAVFLPGAYLASVFSTTFFNFTFATPSSVVSEQFYIYWATTLPITALAVLGWWAWEHWSAKRHRLEDEDLEKQISQMEIDITTSMRKATMKKGEKAGTWDTQPS
jgi:hypothetical protein